MILIRYLLIFIVGYLIVRSVVRIGKADQPSADIRKDKVPYKKVSKRIGEYIDYEDVKKDKSE